MHYHEIEKARRCLRTAGTVEDRAHIRQAAMARLKDEIEVTAQRKDAIQKDPKPQRKRKNAQRRQRADPLSLIVLAASLFTIAHLRGWASRHENEYHGLDTEERASASFLRELLQEEQRTAEPGQMRKPTLLLPEAVSQGKHSIGTVILIAAVLFANSGCADLASDETAGINAATPSQVSAESKESGADLHVFIDWSGSCVRPALDEAWATVKSELPKIIEQYRIGTLTIWSFDMDGWCPKRQAEIELPAAVTAERPKLEGGEWESFSNIRDAVRDVEEREWRRRQAVLKDQYQRELAKAVAPLESADILPDVKYSTTQSDIIGLFERITAIHDRRVQYVIVLTDMADTRRKVWPKIASPKSDVHALALVIPAQASDAALTLGKPLSGPEQYGVRSRQLRESAPWITLAPYFAMDLAKLLSNRGEPR